MDYELRITCLSHLTQTTESTASISFQIASSCELLDDTRGDTADTSLQ
jgi:hypothetical protein